MSCLKLIRWHFFPHIFAFFFCKRRQLLPNGVPFIRCVSSGARSNSTSVFNNISLSASLRARHDALLWICQSRSILESLGISVCRLVLQCVFEGLVVDLCGFIQIQYQSQFLAHSQIGVGVIRASIDPHADVVVVLSR